MLNRLNKGNFRIKGSIFGYEIYYKYKYIGGKEISIQHKRNEILKKCNNRYIREKHINKNIDEAKSIVDNIINRTCNKYYIQIIENIDN